MKYIRTKEGIYRVVNAYWDGTYACVGFDFIKPQYDERIIERKEEIMCSDTIEDLCDQLVMVYGNENRYLTETHMVGSKKIPNNLKTQYGKDIEFGIISAIFGAIWTDKGLIYVAKMNEKGELELL